MAINDDVHMSDISKSVQKALLNIPDTEEEKELKIRQQQKSIVRKILQNKYQKESVFYFSDDRTASILTELGRLKYTLVKEIQENEYEGITSETFMADLDACIPTLLYKELTSEIWDDHEQNLFPNNPLLPMVTFASLQKENDLLKKNIETLEKRFMEQTAVILDLNKKMNSLINDVRKMSSNMDGVVSRCDTQERRNNQMSGYIDKLHNVIKHA